jgi:phenylacetic acid degradation operon negative regulatory protein
MLDIDTFIEQRAELANISCRTFIVTVFGDVVSQHGDWVWLGSLIEILQPLGYSERLVRTSVFRLVKEDWLEVKKVGRKSYYRLTNSANSHYIKAAKRIYTADTRLSENNWCILLPSFVEEPKLSLLKKQLNWLGFSAISAGAYAHPNFDQTSLDETIKELDLADSVVVFSANTIGDNSANVLKKLVDLKWEMPALQQRYSLFIETYNEIAELIRSGVSITDHQCLSLRILMVHEYRRILLTDHELAEDMLPPDWKGHQANQLVESLYAKFSEPSCQYICSTLQSIDGPLAPPNKSFFKRFSN